MSIRIKTAAIARQDIVKVYDGQVMSDTIPNNPRSYNQTLQARVRAAITSRLKADLKLQGWIEKNHALQPAAVWYGFCCLQRGDVTVTINPDGWLTIIGPRNAERPTLAAALRR